jgi:hypothetical protein
MAKVYSQKQILDLFNPDYECFEELLKTVKLLDDQVSFLSKKILEPFLLKKVFCKF